MTKSKFVLDRDDFANLVSYEGGRKKVRYFATGNPSDLDNYSGNAIKVAEFFPHEMRAIRNGGIGGFKKIAPDTRYMVEIILFDKGDTQNKQICYRIDAIGGVIYIQDGPLLSSLFGKDAEEPKVFTYDAQDPNAFLKEDEAEMSFNFLGNIIKRESWVNIEPRHKLATFFDEYFFGKPWKGRE